MDGHPFEPRLFEIEDPRAGYHASALLFRAGLKNR